MAWKQTDIRHLLSDRPDPHFDLQEQRFSKIILSR
ncbi:hypothetical protein CASFOL_020693 [Castilleja foliolosa]|uniref:Uncharacterized protein n=1 Tax=Castilleja foliolosa TaxID=1961234 RepID=A0ABD3D579_9LAMI